MDNLNNLKTTIKLFEYYKLLGEKSIEQISDEKFYLIQEDSQKSTTIINLNNRSRQNILQMNF